jgi:hypothetical protein
LSVEELELTRKLRYDAKSPPGFRDKGKDDGGVGDLAIWLTVLQESAAASRDAIFVSEEGKDDWFHSAGSEPLFPRYELVEEFSAATGGKNFGIMKLSRLLEQVGATKEAIREVRSAEFGEFSRMGTTEIVGWVLLQLRVRLEQATRGEALVTSGGTFPDLLVQFNGEVTGIDVIYVRSKDRSDATSTRIYQSIGKANESIRLNKIRHCAIAIVTDDAGVVHGLENRFAEERFLGSGIGAVVVHVRDSQLKFMTNQSDYPLFKRAFS